MSVEPGYWDVSGQWRQAPPETIAALSEVVGRTCALGRDGLGLVPQAGSSQPAPARAIRQGDDGEQQPTCYFPEGMRAWGLAVQLYALRSTRSWGIGDFGDLRRLCAWCAGNTASLVMLNPLHAPSPGLPQQQSPYYPSSRIFINPLYICVEDVAGHDIVASHVAALREEAQALNAERLVDRDACYRLKMAALEHIFDARPGAEAGFTAFMQDKGRLLTDFATYCAIAEQHGQDWRAWPVELQDPGGAEVGGFRGEHSRRVELHCWLQWLAASQLAAAGSAEPGVGLVTDLAVGAAPGGADEWAFQDVHLAGVRIGAPPDALATGGQDWGLVPLDPVALCQEAGLEMFRAVLAANLSSAKGMRMDHVMGLFRLFLIPPGAHASEGAYVRYPWPELLDCLAAESRRARAWVVGEDLGTVEPAVREELSRRRILGYRLLWFDPVPPPEYPAETLGAVTTHDLPTIAGVWTGSDLGAQRAAGLVPDPSTSALARERLASWLSLPPEAPVGEVTRSAHSLMAGAGSTVVMVAIEDALGVEERPNMPSTTDSWPNWSLALPMTLEQMLASAEMAALARIFASRA
ncbi:MAG: 4-alpha-glucanotransferase [Acidimicrobiales bacterium]